MPGKLVVGNWKMNGDLRRKRRAAGGSAGPLAGAGDAREIAVCVPFPYLWQAQAALSGSAIGWGAQNVSEYAQGAHTGEVAAGMVAEFAAGTSSSGTRSGERCTGETDEMVAAKSSAALEAGMTPIVCVGESWAERESGAGEAVVLRQLDAVASRIGRAHRGDGSCLRTGVGDRDGRSATRSRRKPYMSSCASGCKHEREAANVPLLYGGSVKAGNAKALFACADIDGGLIGGASLNVDEFLAIAGA